MITQKPKAKSEKWIDNRIKVLGVGISSTLESEVLRKIGEICKKKPADRPFFITTVNPEFVMLAQKDSDFARIINASDLAIPDGMGLRLAGKFPEIIPGRKIVEILCTEAKFKSSYRIFFLGGRKGVARKMADIYGGEWDAGEEDIKAGERESKRIISKINKYQPDILLVAYGAPAQEKWLWANRAKFRAKCVMGVGGSFDYLVGQAKIPPEIVSKIGLEWLWRLTREPWRWRRQLKLIWFILYLVFSALP